MHSRRKRKSLSLLAKSAELAIAAPQVIVHRVTRMATAGPTLSARDCKEFHLMVGEKVAGFGEAWSAMVLQEAASDRRSAYQCDGRTHCSQVTSCGEAEFFLANCPGVKMDGGGDGVPCEKQWCGNR